MSKESKKEELIAKYGIERPLDLSDESLNEAREFLRQRMGPEKFDKWQEDINIYELVSLTKEFDGNWTSTYFELEDDPDHRLATDALDQPVAWSGEKIQTLGNYISAKLPRLAKKLKLELKIEEVKEAEELTDDELQIITTQYLRALSVSQNIRNHDIGVRNYTNQEIMKEVSDKTELGLRICQSYKKHLSRLESLLKGGKVDFYVLRRFPFQHIAKIT